MRNNYNTACHNGEIMQGLIIHPCAIMLVSPLPIVARGSRALVALYHNTIQWPSCVTRQLYSMTLYREACPCPRGHNYVRLHTFRPLCQVSASLYPVLDVVRRCVCVCVCVCVTEESGGHTCTSRQRSATWKQSLEVYWVAVWCLLKEKRELVVKERILFTAQL